MVKIDPVTELTKGYEARTGIKPDVQGCDCLIPGPLNTYKALIDPKCPIHGKKEITGPIQVRVEKEKPSDWIRERAHEHAKTMPPTWETVVSSQMKAIIDYLDHHV